MDQSDLKAAIGKPYMLRLKQVGVGIKVGKVLGARVLVKTVNPRTEMDRVEEEGRIIVPKWVKKENTPLPTTGLVLAVGPDIPCEYCGYRKADGIHADSSMCVYVAQLSEGDMVMFPKFSGSDFQIENEDLRIIEAKEILCTLVDTEGALMEVGDGEEDSLG